MRKTKTRGRGNKSKTRKGSKSRKGSKRGRGRKNYSDRKSTRLNSSHQHRSRMPSSA